MIRLLLLVCTALLLGTIALYGLAAREPRAAFTYVNPSDIHTLDPARMSWTQDFRVALNIWEGLTTSDPRTTEPIAGAAIFPPTVSGDRLTYTFTLRDDARWSNGDQVTASDFVRGWRRGMEPGTATDYVFLFTDHIAGAAAYVKWRQEFIGVLTSLMRVRDGRDTEGLEAEALAGRAMLSRIYDSTNPLAAHGIASPGHAADRNSIVDRGSQYDELLQAHAGELDRRFADVGIRAVDDRTLTVELLHPCPYFLDLTAFPTFLPCHASIEILRQCHHGLPITAEGLVVYDPQWTKPAYHHRGYSGLITNGAYRLTDWRFKRRARLTVNPYFRDAADIGCQTVDMLVFENISAALMAYEAGDVDFLPAMDVPYDHEIARLAMSGERADFRQCFTLATYFFNFNCVSHDMDGLENPFLSARVRKAFCLAVDKKGIVDHVLKRGDRIASTFVPPGAITGYESPRGLDQDVGEARRLLAEAGYPGAAGLPPIEILHLGTDERVCQALARMWEQSLGVHVELRCMESKTFGERKADHRFMVARGNWYGDYFDPTTFLDCLATGNGNNDSGYSNSRYDALLAQAAAARDADARMTLLQQAEAIIVAEDVPILPILHYATPIAIQPYVHGIYPNPRLRFPFRYVTVSR